MLRLHMLRHLLEGLQRFGSLSLTNTGKFELFHVLLEKSYRVTSRSFLTRMNETMQKMSSTGQCAET